MSKSGQSFCICLNIINTLSLQHSPREVALLNFWYEFDNTFAYAKPADVSKAIDSVDPYGRLFSKYREHRHESNYPEGLKTEFQNEDDVKSQIIVNPF